MSPATNAINLLKVSTSFRLLTQLSYSLFPHFFTINDLSNMSRGTKVVWDDSGWRFEGWVVSAKSGKNSKVAISFHGFDRSASEMENFMPFYCDDTALLSVNLLHHGESKPLDDLNIYSMLEPSILLEVLKRKIHEEFGDGVEKLELLGYSMGSRVCFRLLTERPTDFSRIIVLAPDGLCKSIIYKFVVNTWIGRFCWSLVDRYPKTNKRIIDSLYKVGLISEHKHHFGRYHTDNSEIRRRVAYGWAAHKKFWPELGDLASAMSKVEAHLVFGNRDKIIPEKWSRGLKDELSKMGCDSVKFHKIESGHVMRHASTVEQIVSAIKS
ncbi:MAG: hypothetical protein CL847_01745 [Crocinitomicaceae bacterium]|nr:hypothetical protein [Crocinitomicaceae bacterium]